VEGTARTVVSGISTGEILALFDEERRTLSLPGYRQEKTDHVTRSTPIGTSWACIEWSSYTSAEIDRAIEDEIAHFAALGCNFEWKVYDHDSPPDLRERLRARGFKIGPAEAFLVMPIGELDLAKPVPENVRRMGSIEEFEDYLAVEQIMWPDDGNNARSESRRRFLEHPGTDGYYVAYADGRPVSCARVTFRQGSRFAGLFGGATLEDFRGRGLYTALITARAMEARQRGIEFLTVDALPTSRPILERRGFRCLSYTYPCTWQVGRAQ